MQYLYEVFYTASFPFLARGVKSESLTSTPAAWVQFLLPLHVLFLFETLNITSWSLCSQYFHCHSCQVDHNSNMITTRNFRTAMVKTKDVLWHQRNWLPDLWSKCSPHIPICPFPFYGGPHSLLVFSYPSVSLEFLNVDRTHHNDMQGLWEQIRSRPELWCPVKILDFHTCGLSLNPDGTYPLSLFCNSTQVPDHWFLMLFTGHHEKHLTLVTKSSWGLLEELRSRSDCGIRSMSLYQGCDLGSYSSSPSILSNFCRIPTHLPNLHYSPAYHWTS